MLGQIDLIDIFERSTPKQQEIHSFQVHMEHFPMLGHKTVLDKPKIEIIVSIFSSHNGMKLEIKYNFKDFYLFIFREREGREKGRETSVCGCLLGAPYWGPGLQPRQVPCQTGDLLVHRPALNPQSHSSQGSNTIIFKKWKTLKHMEAK